MFSWGLCLRCCSRLRKPSHDDVPGPERQLLSGTNGCVLLIAPDGSGETAPGACFTGGPDSISPDGLRVGSSTFDFDIEDYAVSNLDGTNRIDFPGGYTEGIHGTFSADGRLLLVTWAGPYQACCGPSYYSYYQNSDGTARLMMPRAASASATRCGRRTTGSPTRRTWSTARRGGSGCRGRSARLPRR